MTDQLYVVDAFVDGPFSGNPAGVVVTDGPRERTWMQQVAAQLALSETAFVHDNHDGTWSLRWFTPTIEAELCGHATLAAGRVLAARGWREVAFTSRAGPLRWTMADEQQPNHAVIDLPVDPSTTPYGVEAVRASLRGAPVVRVGAGREYVVAELERVEQVATALVDLSLVAELDRSGLVITAADLESGAVVCRMFAPQSGIDEDPVTGSAWCALADWWGSRIGEEFVGQQLSARGGRLIVRLDADRVLLTGETRVVVSGQLHV